MSVLRILRAGNPVLRQTALPVTDIETPEIISFSQDLVDTLIMSGGVGLAANQVGRPLQMLAYRIPENRSLGGGEVPVTVLFNPEVVPLESDTEIAFEGCLSLPGMTGAVPRARRIGLRALLSDGKKVEKEVEGFHARVLQHEYDHLIGKIFVDRMHDLSSFGYADELVLAARHEREAESA